MGCNIELESITSAIKARDLLRQKNIRVKIEKSSVFTGSFSDTRDKNPECVSIRDFAFCDMLRICRYYAILNPRR